MNYIKTDKSSLKVINLEDNINLEEIVNTIKDKLIENPPIMVYGKKMLSTQKHRFLFRR